MEKVEKLPGWAEVERAGWSSIGSGVPREGEYLTDDEVTVDATLEAVRPVFDRLLVALAEARAELAGAQAREEHARLLFSELRRKRVLPGFNDDSMPEVWYPAGMAQRIAAFLDAAPAPPASALLAVLANLERYRSEAHKSAGAADHESMPRVGPPELRAEANAFGVCIEELRAAIGLPPREEG